MRDFTYYIYKELLDSIRNAGYEFQTFEDFIVNPKKRAVVLRHDSDNSSASDLKFARMEHDLRINASYYFRIPKTFNIETINMIAELGHEIGYHYEDLSIVKGDYEKAIQRFENNLIIFRNLYPVKTIAMHGRPLSIYDSKDLWKKYDFKAFGIIGEPYLSVDYNKVLYLTDTGGRWNGEKTIIRDSVLSQYDFNIHSTFQLIDLLKKNELPDLIILNSHPARWNDNLAIWIYQYVFQNFKNVIKYFLKKFVFLRKQPELSLTDVRFYDSIEEDKRVKKKEITRYCLLTNDVETTSIRQNKLSDKIGELVLKEGMPLLLNLYDKYDIKSTFFFTGQIAAQHPEIVRMILPFKHEVGCHGFSHEVNEAFDVLPFNEQVDHLKKAKRILEDISGQEVISFRAPALRVNKDTPKALMEAGFLIDSSIASQRFDFLMSFGSREKLNWITAPRYPYKTKADNLARKGTTHLIEVPVSALILPYIGTTLRVFPHAIRFTRNLLHLETKNSGKPIVFLIHPNEFLAENEFTDKITRRTSNIFKYLFADLLRNKLKVKNLGKEAVILYEKEIVFFKDHNYEFRTIKDYISDIFPEELRT
jgi:peptidoglycan-N-acetylglucosamine deacetylase